MVAETRDSTADSEGTATRAEVQHLEHTLAQVDHECRIAAGPMTVEAVQESSQTILTADQITAFLLGDGRTDAAR